MMLHIKIKNIPEKQVLAEYCLTDVICLCFRKIGNCVKIDWDFYNVFQRKK